LLFHSFSQSVRLLCSLITLPSVRFLCDCTTTTEAAASGVFLLDNSFTICLFLSFCVPSLFSILFPFDLRNPDSLLLRIQRYRFSISVVVVYV
jgi:hypothetical protein